MTDTEKKELGIEDIIVYLPKKLNKNFFGEWIFAIWALCYGVSCRKADNKMMITYNIDPDSVNENFFEKIDVSAVPARVYELFQQKLSSDIARLDNMMTNLVMNKNLVNKLFNFAEQNKTNWVEWFEDAQPYSQSDAEKDRQAEYLQTKNMRRNLQQGPSKKHKNKKRR